MNTIIRITILLVKKPINVDYFTLNEQTELCHKSFKFEVVDRVRITKYKNIFNKGYTKHCSREVFAIDNVLKTKHLGVED